MRRLGRLLPPLLLLLLLVGWGPALTPRAACPR